MPSFLLPPPTAFSLSSNPRSPLLVLHLAYSLQALVSYYDFKALSPPTTLMCQFMLLYAGKGKDNLITKSV